MTVLVWKWRVEKELEDAELKIGEKNLFHWILITSDIVSYFKFEGE